MLPPLRAAMPCAGRQSEPGAFADLLGGEKRLEQPRLNLRRDAHAGVADGQGHVGARDHRRVRAGVVGVELDLARSRS